MRSKNRYPIGEVSRVCNISSKALRYYDKIGLINSRRDEINNYRYYSTDELLLVPVIKYYKQMGFTLDEMKCFIDGGVDAKGKIFNCVSRSFINKIEEHKKAQEETHRQYVSVKDWHDLIMEADTVIDNNIQEVSVKFIKDENLLYQDQTFKNDIEASIINIKFTNYVEQLNNAITGPVIINFSSFKDRMANKNQKVKIMQKTLKDCCDNHQIKFGGKVMISCYHTGPHETINQTYAKICSWADEQRYILGEESFERYVTDYWTTRNSALFVTEVMMGASRKQ